MVSRTQEKQVETHVERVERKWYLVTDGSVSTWKEAAEYFAKRGVLGTPWKPVYEGGRPVVKSILIKEVKLVHMVTADGAADAWFYEADAEGKKAAGWQYVMVDVVREDQSNGKK